MKRRTRVEARPIRPPIVAFIRVATIMDAAEFTRNALRLGLANENQIRECQEELGTTDAQALASALERKQYLTMYQTSKLLKGDTDGYLMCGYKILYKIASGSFGRVYRAEDPRTGVPVAVKELRRRWRDDPHKVDLFEREGRMGLTMRHPNIVQILAVNCDRQVGQHVIVMEFVEGENLREMLSRRGKLEVKEAIRIGEEAAAGLSYAYSRRLTHRDMKPSNILLSVGGTAKLVDFGLAEIAKGSSILDEDDTNVDRTVDYAGLEKATNVPSGDVRSDIFFLGCVLYEMLSGKPALPPTRDRRARMLKSRFENIPPLPRDEVDAPPSVFQLLERMMALDPQLRFQTPSQLHDAVRQVQAELGGGPTVEGFSSEAQRTVFVVEKNLKFQDVFRDKFKTMGFRPLMSIDATRALMRYQQQAFNAIVIDLATTGKDGLDVLRQVQSEAAKHGAKCPAVILMAEEDENLRDEITESDEIAILTFPVKKGALEKTMDRLLPRT
ncbi:MAG: protein kinase domain-containing protein [Gemmataceae bacterium]